MKKKKGEYLFIKKGESRREIVGSRGSASMGVMCERALI